MVGNTVDDDFAYRLVSGKINGDIPDDFVRAAFKHKKIEIHSEIAEKFARPYEKKPWSDYRKIFVKESRIVAGVKFYKTNINLIQEVAEKYEVDPFIVVTIAGVESNYGIHHSQYSVFNSLYSQIHDMPKRSKWATRELAEFLKYCYTVTISTHKKLEGLMPAPLVSGSLYHLASPDIQLTLMVMGFVSHMTGPMFWVSIANYFENEWVQSKQQELYKERRYI